jgi:hypothetical protein
MESFPFPRLRSHFTMMAEGGGQEKPVNGRVLQQKYSMDATMERSIPVVEPEEEVSRKKLRFVRPEEISFFFCESAAAENLLCDCVTFSSAEQHVVDHIHNSPYVAHKTALVFCCYARTVTWSTSDRCSRTRHV